MTISILFLMSLATVAGFLITLSRVIGWQRVLQHATVIDVVFTVMLTFFLAGTLTGVLIAILAGLVMAGVLSVARASQRAVGNVRATAATCVPETDDWCPGGTSGRL